MKNTFLALLFFMALGECHSQVRIKFDYDAGGNQSKRYICINCASRMPQESMAVQDSTAISGLETKMLTKNDPISELSYYPNPVLEELYIKWKNEADNYVSEIEVYSLNGQFLRTINGLQDKESATIAFSSYPQGYYNVVLVYNNGNKKNLKIVKK